MAESEITIGIEKVEIYMLPPFAWPPGVCPPVPTPAASPLTLIAAGAFAISSIDVFFPIPGTIYGFSGTTGWDLVRGCWFAEFSNPDLLPQARMIAIANVFNPANGTFRTSVETPVNRVNLFTTDDPTSFSDVECRLMVLAWPVSP